MAPWKLPLLVAAIVIPVVVAFYFGGPASGLAAGALVAFGVLLAAAVRPPRGRLGRAPAAGGSRRTLIVLAEALEGSAAVAEVAAATGRGPPPARDGVRVLVLAPARIGFLDRWASDVEGARDEAQRRLVLSVAALATAGIEAEARVGDEDLVQAVEDQLGSFPATEVILVSGPDEKDAGAARAAQELRARLRSRFRRVVVSGPAAG